MNSTITLTFDGLMIRANKLSTHHQAIILKNHVLHKATDNHWIMGRKDAEPVVDTMVLADPFKC